MKSATSNKLPPISTARRSTWTKVSIATLLVIVAIVLGRAFGHHIPQLEAWIAAQGPLGYAFFVAAVVLGTSLFVPDTAFALMAGALFGVAWGTALMVVASLLTATLDYWLGRTLFANIVRRAVAQKPQFAAIEQAVKREGLRFQLLLRLTPINPVMVSYALGATAIPFGTFLVACLGLIPALFVEVYFGYVAKHMAKIAGQSSEHSPLHSALTIAGLVLCIAVLVYIVRVARRAIVEAETHASAQDF